MWKLTLVTCLVIQSESVFARTFDQRQTGDLNVQVDVKNVKIFALTKGKEEYVDYDYAYDYSEMTIKPQNGTTTTIKPQNGTTTTIKPLNTAVTVMLINKDNETTTELESTTQMIEKITTPSEHVVTVEPMTIISTLAGTSGTTVNTNVGLETPNNTTAAENSTTTLSDCKKGFYRNKGNCELKLQNPSNILLKMLQKSKSSGGNGIRKS